MHDYHLRVTWSRWYFWTGVGAGSGAVHENNRPMAIWFTCRSASERAAEKDFHFVSTRPCWWALRWPTKLRGDPHLCNAHSPQQSPLKRVQDGDDEGWRSLFQKAHWAHSRGQVFLTEGMTWSTQPDSKPKRSPHFYTAHSISSHFSGEQGPSGSESFFPPALALLGNLSVFHRDTLQRRPAKSCNLPADFSACPSIPPGTRDQLVFLSAEKQFHCSMCAEQIAGDLSLKIAT